MLLREKTVVVTGATRGIGRAIAHGFRSAGAYVVGTGTGPESPTAREVCDEYVQGDFADLDETTAIATHLRGIEPDVLINNAGINKIAPFPEITIVDFMRIQQVNLVAPFLLCQAAIPGMKRKGWGRIVNITSIWSKVSREMRASYSASKFGLDGLTLALALEHARDGILANCVAPGAIETQLTRTVLRPTQVQGLIADIPAGRLGSVDEVARFVVWLASPENTYITGQNIAVDGGFTRA